MIKAKKALALLLCLAMVLSYVPVRGYAASDTANIKMELSATQVNVGDTFTITVSYDDMTIASIGCPLAFDKELVEFVSAVPCDPDYPEDFGLCTRRGFTVGEISTVEKANAIGQLGFVVAGTAGVTYKACVIYTATFRAIAPGTVTFTLNEDSDSTDGFKGVAQVETVVINAASAPSCDHTGKTYTYTANGNDTHKVTCECGEVVEAAVTCSGGTATCTAKAKCDDCGAEYGTALGHKDVDPKDHVCDNGCDVAQGEHKSNAQYPCLDGTCVYCEQTIAATASHTDVDGEDHTCDVCGTENVTNHTAGEPVVSTTPSTCTEGGSVVTETFCTKCGERLTYNSESIPAGSACELGEPAYTWADDYSSCTAEVKCQNGTVHKSETVNTFANVTTPGTCETPEVVTYYAVFEGIRDTSISVTGEKDTTNHAGEPSYEYVDGLTHKVACTACEVEGVEEDHNWPDMFCFCGAFQLELYFWDVSYYPDGESGNGWMTLYAHCGTDFTDTWKLYPVNGYEKIGFYYWNDETEEYYEALDIEYLTIPAEYVEAYYNALLEGDTYPIQMEVYAYNDLFIDLNGGRLREEALEYWADYYDPEKNVINDIWATFYDYYYLDYFGEIMVRDGYQLTGFYDSAKNTTYALTDVLTSNETTTLVAQWQCLHSTTTAVDNGDGTHNVVCGTCGEVSESNVPHTYDENTHECVCGASAHLFEEKDRKDQTCTEEGYVIYACDCGAQEREVIEASGHARVLVYKDEFTHFEQCCACLETLGDPEPHTYDETTHECACGASAHLFEEADRKDPTCTEGGYVIYACDCGAEERLVLEASGHARVLVYKDEFTHFEQCCACLETLGDPEPHTYDETTHECVCGANIHNFVNVSERVDPTCTEEGYVIYACRCGAQEREVINALNHFPTQYNKNDGTHYAKCCVCLETLGDPEPHTYDETTHMCVCGDVENFYLTVYDFDGNPLLNTLVPYGDGIYDYVKDLVCEPVRVETEDEIGYIVFNGWTDGDMNPIEENDTMPAENLNVYADIAFTGWIKYDYNDGWVYEVMNQIQKTGWTEIDGAWYYLNPETGIRAEGMTRVPYPTVEIDGNTYEADAETLAYCQSKGKTFIDAAEAWFNFDEDGKFQSDMTGIVAHPVVENANSYVVNGMLTWHPGLVNPGAYLYFTGDAANGGNILATGDVYVTRNNTTRNVTIGGVYTFGADGKLCEYNGVTNVNGVLRYYQNAQLMLGYGLVETEKGFVFVRSNGAVAIGKYYLTNVSNYDGDALKYGDGVTFGADGYALNGIVDGKYYINGKVAYGAGVVQIEDGKFIYVRSNGEIVTNRSYWITNVGDSGLVATQYTFDENGIMQDPEFVADQLNGIHNGYYYKDGKIVYGAGLIEIEKGVYIYVRSNGQLATGEYWPTNTNDLLPSGKYDFGTDGKLYI